MRTITKQIELRGAIKAMMLVAALSQSTLSWATSTTDEAAMAQAVAQETSTTTKAYLTIEDLKTLLGLTTRTPSAVESKPHAEAVGAYDFIVSLSKGEKNALRQTIHQTERTRAQLVAQLEKDLAEQKAEMRRQRRTLQNSRLSAGNQNDEALSRSIFESLLSESNAEARAEQQLAAFDQTHMVSIEFTSIEGRRVINTIAMGDAQLWSVGTLSQVASK